MRAVDDLWLDLRHAARMLARTPGFTAVAVVSLALGIGANTAIFSVVDAIMLRPVAVQQPERLILLTSSAGNYVRYSMFEKLRDAAASAADLSAIIRTDRYNVGVGRAGGGASQVDGGPVRVARVSGNDFSTRGTTAAMGRTLAPDDDRAAGAPVAVISDDYWSRRFGKTAVVMGRLAGRSEDLAARSEDRALHPETVGDGLQTVPSGAERRVVVLAAALAAALPARRAARVDPMIALRFK